MASETGLRQLKRDQALTALSRAAVTLATEAGGPDSVTVDTIAERATLSRRTFFNYFSTKETAFVWPIYALTRRFGEAIAQRPDDEPIWDVVRRSLENTLTAPETDLDLVSRADALITASPALIFAGSREPGSRDPMETALHQVKAEVVRRTEGDPEIDVYPQLALEGALLALRVSVRVCAGQGGNPLGHIESVVGMLRGGIRPPQT